MDKLGFRITGVAPLIMHNGQLADPLCKWTRAIKEISSRRSKTDADHEEMARLEWYGGLYLTEGKLCVPSHVMEATLIGKGGAARKMKMGKQAAAGLIVENDAPLEYEGPTDIDELWNTEEFRLRTKVNVNGSSVMRTRPIIWPWAAEVEVSFLPELINPDHVIQWMHVAGEESGLMDWRPKFGRFTAELLNGNGSQG